MLINMAKYIQDPKEKKEMLINTDLCHLAIRKQKIKSNIEGAPDTEQEVIDIILTAGLVLGFIPENEEVKKEFLSHFNIQW